MSAKEEDRHEVCFKCRYYDEFGFEKTPIESRWGFCHRYPPAYVEHDEDERVRGEFPEVRRLSYCGEWKPVAVEGEDASNDGHGPAPVQDVV